VQYAVNWFTGREAAGAQQMGGLDAPGLDPGPDAPDSGPGAHTG